jgi:colicin import membrane protein
MGKDSLIKSTAKKKPATEKEDKTKQTQKVSAAQKEVKTKQTKKVPAAEKEGKTRQTKKAPAKAKTAAAAKSDAKPKKKSVKATVKARESAKKKPAAKTKPTKTVKKKPAPKAEAPAPKPVQTPADKKPLPKAETPVVKAPASNDGVPPPAITSADPAEKMLYYGGAGIVILVLIVIIASWMNTQHYYVKSNEGAVDIWQGKFAPKGAERFMSVPGLQLTEPIKDTYTADEVFPIIYQYYLDKADTLLDVPGMPDFDGVKEYLDKSLAHATTREMKTVIKGRLDAINLMVLLYKADVAASKDNLEAQETAMGYLKEALAYQMDDLESTRIKQKIESVKNKIKALKTPAADAATGGEAKKQHQ